MNTYTACTAAALVFSMACATRTSAASPTAITIVSDPVLGLTTAELDEAQGVLSTYLDTKIAPHWNLPYTRFLLRLEAGDAEGSHHDDVGTAYVVVMVPRVLNGQMPWLLTASHELAEVAGNPMGARGIWTIPPPGTRAYFHELCDPVGATAIPVLALGRTYWLSDAVLPAYFQLSGQWPYDLAGIVTTPFTPAPGQFQQSRGIQ